MSTMSRIRRVSFEITVPDGISDADLLKFVQFHIGDIASLDMQIDKIFADREVYDLQGLIPEDVDIM